MQLKGQNMLKRVAPESKQIDFPLHGKLQAVILPLAEPSIKLKGTKEGLADSIENGNFLPLLKEGLAALNIKGVKTSTTSVNSQIQSNMRNSLGIETGTNMEQVLRRSDQNSAEKNVIKSPVSHKIAGKFDSSKVHLIHQEEDERAETGEAIPSGILNIHERQVEVNEVPAAMPELSSLNSDNSFFYKKQIAVEHETGSQNIDVGIQNPIQGDWTQNVVLKDSTAKNENCVPSLAENQPLSAFDHIIGNTLKENGIGEKEINEILVVIKARRDVVVQARVNDDLLPGKAARKIDHVRNSSIPAREGMIMANNVAGRQVFEGPVLPVAVMDREAKFISREAQAAEESVVRDSGGGMLEGMPSVPDGAKRSDRGDLSSLPEHAKAAVPEALLTTLREKGIGEKQISEIQAAIKARQEVITQERINEDLLPGKAERKSNHVRNSSISAREGMMTATNVAGRQVFEGPVLPVAVVERDATFISRKAQAAEESVAPDLGGGILEGMPSVPDGAKRSDRGDVSSLPEHAKAAVQEILLTTLRGKGIGEQQISEILSALKARQEVITQGRINEDLRSGNPERKIDGVRNSSISAKEGTVAVNSMVGPQVFEEPVLPVAVMDREAKFISREAQAATVSAVRDLEGGILATVPSALNMAKNNGRGDLSLLPEKGKAAMPEALLAGRIDIASYGGASMPVKADDAKPIEGHLLVSQIASQIPLDGDKGSGRVKITLYPENLGSLDMDIILRENKVQVVLMAERHDVRQELQNNGDQLRNALQERGLHVDGIDFLLRRSPQEMNGGSGDGQLWWREDNGSAKREKKEQDVPASSAIPLLATRKTGGPREGSISLVV